MKRPPRIILVAVAALLLGLAGLMAFGIFWFQRDRRQTLALEKAETALRQNEFETAIALFNDALQMHLPAAKAASAYFNRAHAEIEKGRYDDAIRDFSEAIRLYPDRVEPYWDRGYAYQQKADWENALRDYSEVLRRDQNAGQVYFNRGLIYLQRKEWRQAVEDFSESIRCQPEYSYGYFDRGSALAELGELDGALASLDAAISIKPDLAEAYQARAAVHRRRGELDLARNDELRTMQLAPRTLSSAAVSSLGPSPSGSDLVDAARRAGIEGRNNEAIDLCNEALKKKLTPSQTSAAFMTRGNGYASKGDWDHALRDYDEAVKIQPANADALANRGNAYAHRKERDKSTHDLNEAIRLNPKLSQAYYYRALNHLDAGALDGTLADLSEAIRLNPKFVEALSRRSSVLMRLKRNDEALTDTEAVLALMPESPAAYLSRARVRLARREFNEARADFERALQRTRDSNAFALNSIAWFFATCPDQASRDGKKAVTLATKACETRQWKNAHTLDTLAAAFAETGDFDQAIKWQTQALSITGVTAAERSEMEKRLALFKRHQPYREEIQP